MSQKALQELSKNKQFRISFCEFRFPGDNFKDEEERRGIVMTIFDRDNLVAASVFSIMHPFDKWNPKIGRRICAGKFKQERYDRVVNFKQGTSPEKITKKLRQDLVDLNIIAGMLKRRIGRLFAKEDLGFIRI